MNAPNGSRGSSPRSFPARFLIRSWEYRHPGAWMNVRLACAVFNLGLCLVLFSFGGWEGVIPLAAAALILWTRNVLRQSTQS